MTGTANAVRWPIEPLLAVTGRPSAARLAVRLNVNTRTIWRWHHRGLTDHQADRAAIAIDLHPANIWPDWFNA